MEDLDKELPQEVADDPEVCPEPEIDPETFCGNTPAGHESLDNLFYYAAEQYCQENECPERVFDMCDRLRRETIGMSYYEGKQRIWEICHDVDGINIEPVIIRPASALTGLAALANSRQSAASTAED